MSLLIRQRLDTIQSKIDALEEEKTTLIKNLKASLIALFDETILSHGDFNTLVGGITSVQKTILENAPEHFDTITQWKKEGERLLNKSVKTKSKKTNPEITQNTQSTKNT